MINRISKLEINLNDKDRKIPFWWFILCDRKCKLFHSSSMLDVEVASSLGEEPWWGEKGEWHIALFKDDLERIQENLPEGSEVTKESIYSYVINHFAEYNRDLIKRFGCTFFWAFKLHRRYGVDYHKYNEIMEIMKAVGRKAYPREGKYFYFPEKNMLLKESDCEKIVKELGIKVHVFDVEYDVRGMMSDRNN